jgi:hypothetical protein
MSGMKKVYSVIGATILLVGLAVGGGCDFAQTLVKAYVENLSGTSTTGSGASSLSFSTPTQDNSGMTSGTETGTTEIIPSAEPSLNLQQLMDGPVITP